MVPAVQEIRSGDQATATSLADLLARDDERFVHCAYQTFLGRDPDPEGLGNYLEQLRTGVSKLQLLTDLRLSPEGLARSVNIPGLLDAVPVPLNDSSDSAQSSVSTLAQLLALQDGGFVRAAYEKLLGREPDPIGFAIYLDQLRSGASKVGILALLRGCAEGKAREANLREWAATARRRSSGAREQKTIVDASAGSASDGPECAAPPIAELLRIEDAPFVATAFQNVLGRKPDTHAEAFYVARLSGGVSRMQVLAEIWDSEEAKASLAFNRDVDVAIRRYKWGKSVAFGWLVRLIADTESENERDRRLRRIESQLFLLRREFVLPRSDRGFISVPPSSPQSSQAGEAIPLAANKTNEYEHTDVEEQENRTIAKPVKSASASLRTLATRIDRQNEK